MPAVQQVAEGEASTFEELYDRYFDAVNRYLRCRVSDVWDADDLTAAVFVKAMENFHRFRGEAPMAVWLFRICHNTFVDYIRSRKKTADSVSLELAAGDSCQPEEEFFRREELNRLRRLLESLPGDYRDVIALRYMGDLKFRQIAQVLGKSEAAVRMSHYRALKMLRGLMARDRGEEKSGGKR